MSTTGIILASGEGSRLRAVSEELGVPKHLFPVGQKTLLERTATELSRFCDQIVVIIRAQDLEKFQAEVSKFSFPVEVYVKSQYGFRGDFEEAYSRTRNERILLTVGDLIFPEGELSRFIDKVERVSHKLVIAFDSSAFFKFRFSLIPDFRMILTAMPKEMIKELVEINPEAFFPVLKKFLWMLLTGRLRPVFQKSLFNINTSDSYQKAKEFFN